VCGYVDDPAPLLAETAVFIVPLLAGGGMRVKILDAWRLGLPVVSTTIGAEGLAVRPEENILLADTPEAFARQVVRILSLPDLADALRAGGQATVAQQYNWRATYRSWEEVYRF